MVLVWIAELPQNVPAPVGLQDDLSRGNGRLPRKPSARDGADVEQGPAPGQVTVLAGIRRLPGVFELSLQIDEVRHTPRHGSKEGGSWRGTLGVISAEANAATLDGVRLHGGQRLLVRRLGLHVCAPKASPGADPAAILNNPRREPLLC